MKKSTIKYILDLLIIVLLILIIIVLNFVDNIRICLIPIILLILLTIIERIFWRCPKCGEYLPNMRLFNKVICCPYCKANIDEK